MIVCMWSSVGRSYCDKYVLQCEVYENSYAAKLNTCGNEQLLLEFVNL